MPRTLRRRPELSTRARGVELGVRSRHEDRPPHRSRIPKLRAPPPPPAPRHRRAGRLIHAQSWRVANGAIAVSVRVGAVWVAESDDGVHTGPRSGGGVMPARSSLPHAVPRGRLVSDADGGPGSLTSTACACGRRGGPTVELFPPCRQESYGGRNQKK